MDAEDGPPRPNILVAWPYLKGDMFKGLAELGEHRFLLDSGAFTAWKAGKVLSLDDYCRFIETLPIRPWRYFSLDVIGDPKATLANYEAMLARGFKPIPVFTRGEDPSVLDDYFKTSDVVGLGGVAKADKTAYAWTRWAMQHVKGRHVHILGFTNMDWVKFLRPYSVDSSSWNRVGRFGWLDVYAGQGRFCTVMMRHIADRKRPTQEVEDAISRLGFDPALLLQREAWRSGRGELCKVSAASWVACAHDMERVLGTKLFLAATGYAQLVEIREGLAGLRRANHPSLRQWKTAA